VFLAKPCPFDKVVETAARLVANDRGDRRLEAGDEGVQ
jgi:hypothetical protein